MMAKSRYSLLLQMRKMLIFDNYKVIDVLKNQILKKQEGLLSIENQVILRKSA